MLADILYYPIGWLYLWLRYRNKKKIKEVLKNEYDNQYYDAGAQFVMSVFGIVLLGLLVILLFGVIGRALYDLVIK